MRREYGDDVKRNVEKKKIIRFAAKYQDFRRNYIDYIEKIGSEPYDFNKDPSGVIRPYEAGRQWSKENPIEITISNKAELRSFIEMIIQEFSNFVQNNKGWQQLWNDSRRPRSEEVAQNLFLAVVKGFCSGNDVDISKEPNIGRGPVDFKISKGYELRALIEVKLAKNTKFWNGLRKQLPKYLEAENIEIGYFLVVCYSDKDFERISGIDEEVRELNKHLPYTIKVEIVDASWGPPSASLL